MIERHIKTIRIKQYRFKITIEIYLVQKYI